MRQLPHSIALQQTHADDGLVVITVNFDAAGQMPDALRILKEAGATTTNLTSRDGFDNRAFADFRVPDGSLPHYKIFDRQGKLHKQLVSDDPNEPLTPESIEAAVEEALR